MSGGTGSGRDLDFIVVGAQKAGTTSLWQYIRGHPQIAMPEFKEAPVFCFAEDEIPQRLERFMRLGFAAAGADEKLGKAAPNYMMGVETADVETIVARIAATFPDVRLIMLLRDPIERAMSHYRMSVRRGFEQRPFDLVVEELLQPEALRAGRERPTETNSYLVQGEYARVIDLYRRRFAAGQIHVETTADLGREPERVVDRVFGFLGLTAEYTPGGLDVRHFLGGTRPRLDPEANAQLRDFMRERVWPHLDEEGERVKLAFSQFMQVWNVIPDDSLPPLSAPNRRRLERHFREDGERLAGLGAAAPWLTEWRR